MGTEALSLDFKPKDVYFMISNHEEQCIGAHIFVLAIMWRNRATIKTNKEKNDNKRKDFSKY
jgi:hypothetical protein